MNLETRQATSSGRAEGVLPQDVLQSELDVTRSQPIELTEGMHAMMPSRSALIDKFTPGIIKRKREERQAVMLAERARIESISNSIGEFIAQQRKIREKGFLEPIIGPSPTTTLAD